MSQAIGNRYLSPHQNSLHPVFLCICLHVEGRTQYFYIDRSSMYDKRMRLIMGNIEIGFSLQLYHSFVAGELLRIDDPAIAVQPYPGSIAQHHQLAAVGMPYRSSDHGRSTYGMLVLDPKAPSNDCDANEYVSVPHPFHIHLFPAACGMLLYIMVQCSQRFIQLFP